MRLVFAASGKLEISTNGRYGLGNFWPVKSANREGGSFRNLRTSSTQQARVSDGFGAALGVGPRTPLGGLFSFGGSIQQSCGLLHGEERRPPGRPSYRGTSTPAAAQVADCEGGWGMDLRVFLATGLTLGRSKASMARDSTGQAIIPRDIHTCRSASR